MSRFLPYFLIAVIVLGEVPTFGRKRPESRSRDRGSYWLIMALVSSGFWLAFCWPYFESYNRILAAIAASTRIGPWGLLIGALLTVGGTAFRVWAVSILGRYFTRTVEISSDQKVVDAGPYAFIRHPAYTGSITAAAGVGLALRSWVSLAFILIPMGIGFAYRVKVEEAALAEAIGEPYRAYMARTKRLIPFFF